MRSLFVALMLSLFAPAILAQTTVVQMEDNILQLQGEMTPENAARFAAAIDALPTDRHVWLRLRVHGSAAAAETVVQAIQRLQDKGGLIGPRISPSDACDEACQSILRATLD